VPALAVVTGDELVRFDVDTGERVGAAARRRRSARVAVANDLDGTVTILGGDAPRTFPVGGIPTGLAFLAR